MWGVVHYWDGLNCLMRRLMIHSWDAHETCLSPETLMRRIYLMRFSWESHETHLLGLKWEFHETNCFLRRSCDTHESFFGSIFPWESHENHVRVSWDSTYFEVFLKWHVSLEITAVWSSCDVSWKETYSLMDLSLQQRSLLTGIRLLSGIHCSVNNVVIVSH